MPNRYSRAPKLKNGQFYGTWDACYVLYRACSGGLLDYTQREIVESERLDILAGEYYGDGRLWWIIAGASGIGWNLQVPPGIYLRIPTDLGQVTALLG